MESVFFSPRRPILTRTFFPSSLSIHSPRVHEEGKQARFPQGGSADQGEGAIRQLLWPGPLPLPRGPCQGRRLRCDDGRRTGQ
jgi:hypothetical protein